MLGPSPTQSGNVTLAPTLVRAETQPDPAPRVWKLCPAVTKVLRFSGPTVRWCAVPPITPSRAPCGPKVVNHPPSHRIRILQGIQQQHRPSMRKIYLVQRKGTKVGKDLGTTTGLRRLPSCMTHDGRPL